MIKTENGNYIIACYDSWRKRKNGKIVETCFRSERFSIYFLMPFMMYEGKRLYASYNDVTVCSEDHISYHCSGRLGKHNGLKINFSELPEGLQRKILTEE